METTNTTTDLATLTYADGIELRTARDGDEVIVCLADLARGLGIQNASQLGGRLPKGVCRTYTLQTAGGPQKMTFVTEAGMNMVIWRSDKPAAVAALITQAGAPIGSGTLFRWLRKHGWLCKRLGRMWNHPTQWAIDKGYIRARIHFVSTASGDMERVTPQVTVAGQQALIEGWATGEFFDDLTGADK